MHQDRELPFQPITLQIESTSQSTPVLPAVKVQEYHHLLKMKKALADTQQKMENRINLFKKASQKIIKQQELHCKVFSKIEAIRQQSPHIKHIHRRRVSRPLSHNRTPAHKENHTETEAISMADKLHQERLNNARSLKEEKSRFKVVIQERKKIDLQRKLQSANGIRRNRNNGKQAREQLEHQRREQLQKELMEKFSKEREDFLEIEKKLNQLQTQEEEALVSWKRTLEQKS